MFREKESAKSNTSEKNLTLHIALWKEDTYLPNEGQCTMSAYFSMKSESNKDYVLNFNPSEASNF